MDAKISVIIPAYNIQEYLGATLDSVLAQTYENLEVIVVNDGSSDGTAKIIDSYALMDSRIRAIHKHNGGVTSARLRGIAEAKGEYIGFVDGDDYIEPDMYARLVKNAQEHDADISHCGYRMVFPNGRVDWYYNTGRCIDQDTETGLRDLVSGEFVEPGVVNKLYRKPLLNGLEQRMDTSIKNNEDVLMNYWLFKAASKAVFEDFCPYHYILRRGSAATAKLNVNKLIDPIKVSRMIWQDWPCTVTLLRLIRQLIGLATMADGEQADLIRPHRTNAQKELRSLLGHAFRQNIGVKLKIMALWASLWPASYSWVHQLYSRVTGNDKKYDLE